MPNRPRDQAAERRRGGFTLAEMMVAVGILIVVIAATAKIFGTVSKVTGLGQASADILQEAAAIERQIRADFERLSPEGYFAIRCTAVPNDINLLTSGRLLNTSLPPNAPIRADQLVFFTTGVQSIQTFRQGAGISHKAQGTEARVYYGHAFQVPQGPPAEPRAAMMLAIDPPRGNPLLPWSEGSRTFVQTEFHDIANGGDYTIQGNFGDVDATQPPAPRWLLARQVVVLANDGREFAVFLRPSAGQGGVRSTARIDDRAIRNGRVDVAAQQLNDIRISITRGGTIPWVDQRGFISNQVFYPRAERVAPSMHRVDQALTNHVLASACSSFIVEWTYADGVGFVENPPFDGIGISPSVEQPWFGLADPDRGVFPFRTFRTWTPADTILPDNIEGAPPRGPPGLIDDYEAFFGFNRDTPLDPATDDVWSTARSMMAYTPWPSAIRITLTLHDTNTRLERGREIQFVIDLPKRAG